MVVDSAQAAHCAVGDIGTVLLRDLLVALHHQVRMTGEIDQRLVEPIPHEPFHMIGVAGDGAGGSALPL